MITPSAALAEPGASARSHSGCGRSSNGVTDKTYSEDEEQLKMTYGFYTDHALAFHDFPPNTVDLLRTVQVSFQSARWEEGIMSTVPSCSPREAEDIAAAMRKDWGLPPK